MDVRSALAKIGTGLLLGVGIGIALAGIGYLLWYLDKSEIEEPYYKAYSAEAGLVLRNHRPQRAEANTAFIGEVVNTGKDSWSNVKIVVELFQADGQFIDKCSGHMERSIAPGQTRNFKVSCLECRGEAPPPYVRYTIGIVDANFERPEA